MPATPEFTEIVPGPWDLDKLIALIQINKDNVIINRTATGELTLAIGYAPRDDGCLVKVR